ncbi:hypothetical protein CVT24_010067, partial [Panaeolus cyanescens]
PVLAEVDDSWVWITCKRCPAAWSLNNRDYPDSRKWWVQWVEDAAAALKTRPWGNTIKKWDIVEKAMKTASECPNCGKKAREDLEAFSQMLTIEIEKDISLPPDVPSPRYFVFNKTMSSAASRPEGKTTEGNDSVATESAPIDTLPEEILRHIFLFNCVPKWYEANADQTAHSSQDTTLSSALTCKRWYSIIFSYPQLWNLLIDYECRSIACISELIRRSYPAPLDFGSDTVFRPLDIHNEYMKKVLRLVFQHASQLRTVNIKIRLAPWQYICKHFLQYPAPFLEFLNISTASPFPDLAFYDSLFAGEAPRLRRLHLQHCLVDFTSPVLHQLTELSVTGVLPPNIPESFRNTSNATKPAPSPKKWLEILGHMPSLKYLTLNVAISKPLDPDENNDLPEVILPNLKLLTIGGRFQNGMVLLNQLITPKECGIRLRLSTRGLPVGIGARLFTSFLTRQQSYWPIDTPNRYLQAKLLSSHRIHFGNSKTIGFIWDTPEADVIEGHSKISQDPLLWLALTYESVEETMSFFNTLLDIYQPTFPTTKTLDFWVDEEYRDTFSISHSSPLKSFTSVSTLNLVGQSHSFLLPLFQSVSTTVAPLFPKLHTIEMLKPSILVVDNAPSLVFFLHWRKKIGSPLSEVRILDAPSVRTGALASVMEMHGIRITNQSSQSAGQRDSDSDDEF